MAERRKRFVWNARIRRRRRGGRGRARRGGIRDARTAKATAGLRRPARPAKPRAAALDPLVGGEVAAFQVAREPEKLSDLAFTGADGEPMTLAAFEGKVALVNLWATWCAPCRQEMPALDRLQAALGGEDFAVVPVSIDTGDPERPAEFLKSIGVKNLPLYTDRTTEIFRRAEEARPGGRASGHGAPRPQRLPPRPHQRPGGMGQRGRTAADRSGAQGVVSETPPS